MKNSFKILALIPSFYGAVVWILMLSLLYSDIVYVYPLSYEGFLLFFYIVFMFILSSIFYFRRFKYAAILDYCVYIIKIDKIIFIIISLIGVSGLLKYIFDFSQYFGSISELFIVIFDSPLELRAMQSENTSIGFQISYFSWISIFFGILILLKGDNSRIWILGVGTVVLVEIVLNLAFIDRTRPIWLLVICLLGVFFRRGHEKVNIRKLSAIMFLSPVSLFLLFSLATGKIVDSVGLFGTVVYYVVGGFGYMDSLIQSNFALDYIPKRTLYPIFKILEAFSVVGPIPSQVLDFRAVPFPTNVATFVEPLYSDGGGIYIFFGIPLLIFGTDYLALRALSNKTPMGLFIWANLVFTAMIGFFVPKFNSTAIFLFVIIWIISKLFKRKVDAVG